MRYLRLLALFARTSFLTELEYRANFIAQALVSLSFVGATFTTTLVLFSHTERVGGWRYDEALIVASIYVIVDGLIISVLQPNVKRIIEMVRDGTMDFTLLKPVNAQFMVSARHISSSGLIEIAAGLALLGVALTRLNYQPDAASVASFAFMFTLGLAMVYSIWIAMATTSFWFVKVGNLTELFNALFETGRFPISAFRGVIRAGLTFVVPVAFITTFPAQAVLRTIEPGNMAMGVGMALAALALSAAFWRYAIRSYSSASS